MAKTKSLPLIVVEEGSLPAALTPTQARWAKSQGFSGQRGKLLALPGEDGAVAGYLFGLGAPAGRPGLILGSAATALEPGRYRLEGEFGDPTLAALGFRLGAYRFDSYRKPRDAALLDDLPAGVDPCGENGEFHTCVYAGPLWQEPIRLARGERVLRDGRFQYIDLVECDGDGLPASRV